MPYKRLSSQSGLTLVELVATIALMSILGAGVANFIAGPIRQYIAIAERATLASVGDHALRVISTDIKAAVPNSARIKDAVALELLHTASAKLYRAGSDDEGLHFNDLFSSNGGDQYFRILGTFDEELIGEHPTWRAVVYPLPAYQDGDMDKPISGVNVYSPNNGWSKNIIDAAEDEEGKPVLKKNNASHYGHALSSMGVSFARGDAVHTFNLDEAGWLANPSQDIVKLTIPHTFAKPSDGQRIYFTDMPITYYCDLSKKELVKYWGYSLAKKQPLPNSSNPPAGGKSAVVANGISGCQFSFGTARGINTSIVVITLEMTSRSGESVTISQEVHIRNDA